MSRVEDLDGRYLQALSQINPSLRHGLRSQLGAVKLQSEVILEVMKMREPGDLEAWAKIQDRSQAALRCCDELLLKIRQVLTAIGSGDEGEAALDLRGVVRDVGGLLAFYVHDHHAFLEVLLPDRPVALGGSRDVIQRALLVVLLEASRTLGEQETLELRLDADGVLQVSGASVDRWLPKVADIVEHIGAGIDARSQGSSVAIRLPVQTRI